MARRYRDDYDDRNNDRYDDQYDDRYDDNYNDNRYADEGYADDGYDDEGYADEGYDDGYDDGYGDNYRDDRYDRSYGKQHYADDYDDGYDDYADDDEGYEDDRRSSRSRRTSRSNKSARTARGSKSGKGSKKRIILFVVEIAILLVVICVLYFMTRLSKTGKANLSDADLQANISDEAKASAETGAMKGFRNIALFGVDSTEGDLDKNTRSDTIMIMSINEDTGEVKLVSVYRDTLLNLMNGKDDYNKANTAYAQGGPEQAIAMLNANLDLNITDFVTVGFGGLTDVINALGGIEIEVTEDEISHLNNYQSTMAEELGMKYTEVDHAGLQTLDGLQATAYCRVRYTSGWDYKRAARQRAVLYAVMEKAKQASPTQLAEIANNAFSEIYTSYDLSDIITDVQAVANYSIASEESIDTMSNGFPQADLRIQANLGNALGDCVVPRSLAENVQWLHGFLFGDSDYQVSTAVQTYSDYIDETTKDAVPEEMTDADHA